MNYYIEIALHFDQEIGLDFLWKKVFMQVHLALVENSKGTIGVSFPECGNDYFPLGNKLRLFASSYQELKTLDLNNWLEKLWGYIDVSEIKPVPDGIKRYAKFTRRQVKTGKERLARRYAKRHNVTFNEALKYYENMEKKMLSLPFIKLQSLSTKQEMKIFIEKLTLEHPQKGSFNSYGLSSDATVPCF